MAGPGDEHLFVLRLAEQLVSGKANSIAEIAKREGISRSHASRLLTLASLGIISENQNIK